MASRKLLRPNTAVYQAGRGSEPMIEVGSAISADALYIAFSLALCPRSEIEGFALGRRILHQAAVGLGQWRAGIAEAVDDGVAAGAAEISQGHLGAGGRLPPLVLGKMQHALDLYDGLAIETLLDDLGDRLLALDQKLRNLVEDRLGRQRVLMGPVPTR